MRRSSPSLPLTLAAPLALLLLGVGCSSTGESLGPTPGSPGVDSYGEGGEADDEDAAESSGGSDGSGSDSDGELPPAEPEPDPEPDDDGGDDAFDEPEAACDLESEVSRWILPEDSNSTASPVLARQTVLDDGALHSIAIRTWEFFNYYDFGYPAAAPGSLLITPALVQPADAPAGEFLLQVGVSSEQLDPQARAPMSVTLVLDTSGSMSGGAMETLREACTAIAASLTPGDVISIVTWNAEAPVVLARHPVTGPDDPELLAKIESLAATGTADLHTGLQAGYELAEQAFVSDGINRVVLVSDGGIDASPADLELIAQHGGSGEEEGIVLVGVGVGDASSYRDDLVDAVTAVGKGSSVFVGDPEEAWATFHDRFLSTMAVAARGVQVRLDLPPGFELVGTGSEATAADVDEVEPQHLAPNDAMVLHHRIRTCAPTEIDPAAEVTVTVIWIDAVTHNPRQVQRVSTLGELVAADPAPLYKGAAVLAYAEGLKAYKRAEPEGRVQSMSGAFAALAQAEAVLPDDPELAEIRQVLELLSE